jgi:hypothetical protein
MADLGRTLVVLGGVLVVAGLVLTLGPRLPGDFTFRRGGVTFYFPLAASLLASLLLTLLVNLLFRRK